MVNFRLTIKFLGILTALLSSLMLFPFLWAVGEFLIFGGEHQPIIILCFTISMIVGFLLSFLFYQFGKNGQGQIFRREAFLLVTLAWSVGAVIAALPFYCFGILGSGKISGAHQFQSLLDCIFEKLLLLQVERVQN